MVVVVVVVNGQAKSEFKEEATRKRDQKNAAVHCRSGMFNCRNVLGVSSFLFRYTSLPKQSITAKMVYRVTL